MSHRDWRILIERRGARSKPRWSGERVDTAPGQLEDELSLLRIGPAHFSSYVRLASSASPERYTLAPAATSFSVKFDIEMKTT